MSRTVIPPAYNEMIISSRPPPTRRAPFGTSRGSKDETRSRGTSNGTGPTSVSTVLPVLPLREFGEPRPAGSPFS
jgi:hypothetical protein